MGHSREKSSVYVRVHVCVHMCVRVYIVTCACECVMKQLIVPTHIHTSLYKIMDVIIIVS